MTTPITAVLAGSLTGATQQGSLTPVPMAYSLDAQTGHQQLSATVEPGETKPVVIPTNLGGPVATPDGQNLLIVTCDIADVEITLNSLGVPVGPFQFPKAGGVLVLPGHIGAAPGVPVADLSIVNNDVALKATVTVTAIYGG